jgi:hypothetical protein
MLHALISLVLAVNVHSAPQHHTKWRHHHRGPVCAWVQTAAIGSTPTCVRAQPAPRW